MSYNGKQNFVRAGWVALMILVALPAQTQYRQEPGHSIGTVTKQGNLIILTLDEDVLGKANLFNLAHHTLRFTPEGSRYRVETIPTKWDSEFGTEMSGSEAHTEEFRVPFLRQELEHVLCRYDRVDHLRPACGSSGASSLGRRCKTGWRPSVDRFAELQQAGPAFINTVAAISVFFKPRLTGMRYLKE